MSVGTLGQSQAAGAVGASGVSTAPWSIFNLGQGAGAQWAQDLLTAGGLPVVASNEQFLYNWALREGGGGMWNPLNTTLRLPGSASLAGNSAGVQAYGTEAQGLQATLQTLQGYPSIWGALKAGNASQANTSGTLAGDLSKWSGGGYTTVGTATPPAPISLTSSLGGGLSGILPGIITGGLAPGAGAVSSIPGVSGIVGGVEGWLLRVALGLVGAVLIILALVTASHSSDMEAPPALPHTHGAEHVAEEAAA